MSCIYLHSWDPRTDLKRLRRPGADHLARRVDSQGHELRGARRGQGPEVAVPKQVVRADGAVEGGGEDSLGLVGRVGVGVSYWCAVLRDMMYVIMA